MGGAALSGIAEGRVGESRQEESHHRDAGAHSNEAPVEASLWLVELRRQANGLD